MASVLVKTTQNWSPNNVQSGNSGFAKALIEQLPLIVAELLLDVDESADIYAEKVLVDDAQFGEIAQNTPDVWVVLTIAANELYVNAKTTIRDNLKVQIRDDILMAYSHKPILSIDVAFTDGTGLLLDENGEVTSSW
jgi:hypothetical protein